MRAFILRSKLYFILLCFIIKGIHCDENKIQACDDGVSGIHEDLEDYKCRSDIFELSEYELPAGESECTENTLSADHVCMSSPIVYNTTPPSSGPHRMIWPQYGEYSYVPPQRWVHSLEHGAVVFLYHPCAPKDQVAALRRLARSCLWKYIITPYPHLTEDKPLALVTWGCVYRMLWVDVEAAETWIKHHALQSPEGHVAFDGTYTFGLLTPATIVSTADDSEICPKSHDKPVHNLEITITHNSSEESTSSNEPPTATSVIIDDNTLSSPKTELPDESHDSTNRSHGQHSVSGISIATLVLLTGILAMLMVIAMLCLLWRRYPPRKRHGRYKNFLPMSLRSDTGGIAIPTIGIPRSNNRAEAEILIPDDDDDEI